MSEIVLTEEQAKLLQNENTRVTVKDPTGRVVGYIEPTLSPEFIAELKRRAATPGPRFSGTQIQARLAALQLEWERTGGFDAAQLRPFLDQLAQSDPEKYGPKKTS
jgi:hypothetical protein